MILFVIIVLILLALAIYGVTRFLPMIESPFKEFICLLLIALAIYAIASKAGIWIG